MAKDVGDQCSQLCLSESGQLNMLQVPAPVEFGQGRLEGMLGVELVAALGHQDQQALLARHADEEDQQIQGRAIRPVRILDHQHDGSPPAEPVQ